VGVKDVVGAMTRLMHSGISGERYILSEGDYSYQQVFEMIGRSLGLQKERKPVSASMMRNLVRLDALAGVLTGKRRITMDHVRGAFSEVHFSNEKIKDAVGIPFTPLDRVIEEVAERYLKDHPPR
jgi:nucleoside-diphosphate-sugar epimerase